MRRLTRSQSEDSIQSVTPLESLESRLAVLRDGRPDQVVSREASSRESAAHEENPFTNF